MPRLRDLTGQMFGRLTVLGRAPNIGTRVRWHCMCECGGKTVVDGKRLTMGRTRGCGCQRGRPMDITGHRFGRLVAIERAGRYRRTFVWRCRCDCGGEAIAKIAHLRNGNTTSCGCAQMDAATTHGDSYTSLYKIWRGLRDRCTNPESPSYKRYGARGITVCREWLDDYERFRADMGPRPSRRHSIDRIDNDGPYSPDNCRWALPIVQSRSARGERNGRAILTREQVIQIRRLYAAGHRQADLARRMGVAPTTIQGIVERRTWRHLP